MADTIQTPSTVPQSQAAPAKAADMPTMTAFPAPKELLQSAWTFSKGPLWKRIFKAYISAAWPFLALLATLAIYALISFIAPSAGFSEQTKNIIRLTIGLIGIATLIFICIRIVRLLCLSMIGYIVIKNNDNSKSTKELFEEAKKYLGAFYFTHIRALFSVLLFWLLYCLLPILALYAIASFTAHSITSGSSASSNTMAITNIIRIIIGFLGIATLATVPAFLLTFRYVPLGPLILFNDLRGKEALKQSRELSKGFHWAAFLTNSIITLSYRVSALLMVIPLILYLLLGKTTAGIIAVVIVGLIAFVIGMWLQLTRFLPFMYSYHILFVQQVQQAKAQGIAQYKLPLGWKFITIILIILSSAFSFQYSPKNTTSGPKNPLFSDTLKNSVDKSAEAKIKAGTARLAINLIEWSADKKTYAGYLDDPANVSATDLYLQKELPGTAVEYSIQGGINDFAVKLRQKGTTTIYCIDATEAQVHTTSTADALFFNAPLNCNATPFAERVTHDGPSENGQSFIPPELQSLIATLKAQTAQQGYTITNDEDYSRSVILGISDGKNVATVEKSQLKTTFDPITQDMALGYTGGYIIGCSSAGTGIDLCQKATLDILNSVKGSIVATSTSTPPKK